MAAQENLRTFEQKKARKEAWSQKDREIDRENRKIK